MIAQSDKESQREVDIVANPSAWPEHPNRYVLPLKRTNPDGSVNKGCLIDVFYHLIAKSSRTPLITGYSAAVWLCKPDALPNEPKDLRKALQNMIDTFAPCEVYDTPEEIVLAGWRWVRYNKEAQCQ